MTRGRKPTALLEVEARAVSMWATAGSSQFQFADVEARLFGMGEILGFIGQGRASKEAFFLASLAGHIARSDLAKPMQGELV